jgi:hypothetical protein
MESEYKNWLGIGEGNKHEEEIAKLNVLQKMADKPATTNTLIYIIPVVALIIFGVIFAVVLKKKKSAAA